MAIEESLVRRGVHVIMVTHSPSTIAVASPESVHVMRAGEPGIHKTTKQGAISALTEEIPTLSISFHGRRQVFVESEFDAERYELIYRRARPLLGSDRSLTFVPIGAREQITGSDQVKQIVRALSLGGNQTVLGLIDWDTKNDPGSASLFWHMNNVKK